MACALTQGYTVDCRDSAGGVKAIYIIEFDNVSGVTESAGVATAILKANGKRFWKYNLQRATAEASEAFQDNLENGTSFNKQTVNFILNKLQATTRNEIVLLAQNRLLMVIEDRNTRYWLYGRETGLMREGGKSGTGKVLGDRNGYELIFTGDERVMALEVQSGIIAGLETP
jgi:hypothetical protein